MTPRRLLVLCVVLSPPVFAVGYELSRWAIDSGNGVALLVVMAVVAFGLTGLIDVLKWRSR